MVNFEASQLNSGVVDGQSGEPCGKRPWLATQSFRGEECMTRMRRCLALVVLIGSSVVPVPAASQSPESSPFSGTWVANIAKSKRHPNHQFQSATMEFAVAGNTVTLKHGGGNAGGQPESGTLVLEADGKEHPVPEAPGVTVVTRWVGPRVLHTIGKSAGAQVGEQTYEVSTNGKVLTAKVSGVDASGTRFDQTIVFDRK